ERIDGFLKSRGPIREESFAGTDDERSLVIVKARAVLQERGNLVGISGPQEFRVSQRSHGGVRPPRVRLDRHHAKAQLLEKSLVRQRSRPTKLLEPRLDDRPLRIVLGAQRVEIAIAAFHGVKKANTDDNIVEKFLPISRAPRAPATRLNNGIRYEA